MDIVKSMMEADSKADEHLLRALVLAPQLLNTVKVAGLYPKCLEFQLWYHARSTTLPWGSYATSEQVADSIGNRKEPNSHLQQQILDILSRYLEEKPSAN